MVVVRGDCPRCSRGPKLRTDRLPEPPACDQSTATTLRRDDDARDAGFVTPQAGWPRSMQSYSERDTPSVSRALSAAIQAAERRRGRSSYSRRRQRSLFQLPIVLNACCAARAVHNMQARIRASVRAQCERSPKRLCSTAMSRKTLICASWIGCSSHKSRIQYNDQTASSLFSNFTSISCR